MDTQTHRPRLSQEDLLDLVKDQKVVPGLLTPKRCGRCDCLMAPERTLEGESRFICPNCPETATSPQ